MRLMVETYARQLFFCFFFYKKQKGWPARKKCEYFFFFFFCCKKTPTAARRNSLVPGFHTTCVICSLWTAYGLYNYISNTIHRQETCQGVLYMKSLHYSLVSKIWPEWIIIYTLQISLACTSEFDASTIAVVISYQVNT